MKKNKRVSEKLKQDHFLEEKFLFYVFKVSVYLLFFRVGYTFLFAMLMGESWFVQWIWGWIPVISFTSPPAVFAELNSYSLLAMAATEFIIFVIIILKKRHDVRYKFWAWYMGIMMTVIQYATLLWLSKKVQFGIRDDLWLPLAALAVAATLLVYFFKNRVYHNEEVAHESKNSKSK